MELSKPIGIGLMMAGLAGIFHLRQPIEPEFRARSMPGGIQARLKSLVGAPLSLPFEHARHQSVVNQSLLIRSLDTVDNEAYEFEKVFSQICKALGYGDKCAEIQSSWASQAASALPSYFNSSSSTKNFRLVAIINRADLATFSETGDDVAKHTVNGAEVRFEYCVIDSNGAPRKASLIVELTLKSATKQAFKEYVAAWFNYKDNGHTLAKHLDSHVWTNIQSARIRQFGDVNGTWPTQQYSIEPDRVVPSLMDREPPRYDCGGNRRNECFNNWLTTPGNACSVIRGQYSFGSVQNNCCCQGNQRCEMFPPNSTVVGTTFTEIEIPQLTVSQCGVDISLESRETVRKLVNLGSCGGCHSSLTDAKFTHIFPRSRGEESCLSGFLTGATQSPDTCTGSTPPLITTNGKLQNDLLRRHLFMVRMLGLSNDENWTSKLSLLSALQIH